MCKYRRIKFVKKKSGESEGPEFSLSEIHPILQLTNNHLYGLIFRSKVKAGLDLS